MTFDTRVRRAAQGIHRAVEVMEMSNTKTPQRITRFDRYRERRSRNQRIAALAVGIAVPAVLVLAAVFLLRSDRGPDVPVGPPTVAPTVAPTVVTGSSERFKAPFTYTVPQDWTFAGDGFRSFSLETPGAASTDVIVLSHVVAAATDCSNRPEQGVGTSSEAITSWLSAHPALDATAPRPVRLGAATGSYVDVQLAADAPKNCLHGLTLVTAQPDRPQSWDLGLEGKERYYVLDLPSGDTVTIVVTSLASEFKSAIDRAAPVVESFDFHK